MVALGDIMIREVTTVAPDTPVAEAAAEMVAGRFGSVVVVSGAVVVGILTERDVLRATAQGRDPTGDPVRNWMTPDPVCHALDTDSDEAEQTMLSRGFRHLPIVDGGNLRGIVSLRDLLSARIRHRR